MIRKWYVLYLDFSEDEHGKMEAYQFVMTVEAISVKEAMYKAYGKGARRITKVLEAVTDTVDDNYVNYDIIRFN